MPFKMKKKEKGKGKDARKTKAKEDKERVRSLSGLKDLIGLNEHEIPQQRCMLDLAEPSNLLSGLTQRKWTFSFGFKMSVRRCCAMSGYRNSELRIDGGVYGKSWLTGKEHVEL